MSLLELNDVIKYQHKIKKIAVTNNNTRSIFNEVVLKISIECEDNEIIRFSLEKDNHFLVHQRIEDDYYCRIPNNLKDVTYIYAHFLPSDLYDYDEDDVIFSIYNFQEMFEENPTSHYHIDNITGLGEPYNITINKNRYEEQLDEEGRLIVRSTDSKSVTGYNDPNYKNYTNDDGLGNNMTQTGYYPLSSRYRQTQNWESPEINTVTNSHWKTTHEGESNNSPYWEARIHRKGLSPLITESAEDNVPINVFMNYTYLPSSREYHQHFYGFEPTETDTCKTINVLEGENLVHIDPDFQSGDKYSNYRLINIGDVYDDSKSIYVPHGNSINIPLENFTPHTLDNNKQTCIWKENICDKYYQYIPIKEELPDNVIGHCRYKITLKEDTYYSLKYYVYIPSYARIEDDTCYMVVQADDITYKLHSSFISQDHLLRNQWIYHEIPFKAGKINTIKIIGPQTFNQNEDKDNRIYFINIGLQEMGEYSPTIKYTNYGVYLTEKNEYTFKPMKEAERCVNTKKNNLIDTPWTPIPVEELPTPYGDVIISILNEKYVYYDTTSNIRCIHPIYASNEQHIISHDNNTGSTYQKKYYKWINNKTQYQECAQNEAHYVEEYYIKDDEQNTKKYQSALIAPNTHEDIQLSYNTNTTDLSESYTQFLKGIRGQGNNFTFLFKDIMGNRISGGKVKAAIFLARDYYADWSDAVGWLPEKTITNGEVTWSNIDLTNLPYNEQSSNKNRYFVRLEYKDDCQSEEVKIDFKNLYLLEEIAEITDIKITTPNDTTIIEQNGHFNITQYNITNINQLPIKISARIKDQMNHIKTDGWCELSIDDDLNQSSLIDHKSNDIGWVDFYLNFNDLHAGKQTIKIEYYRQYNKAISFIYFDLYLDPAVDGKDAVLININILENNTTTPMNGNIYEINRGDCALYTIATGDHDHFRLEVYRQKIGSNNIETIFQQNIYSRITEGYAFISAEYGDESDYKFTIKTGNMLDQNGNPLEDKYRNYQREFTIRKKSV